MKRRAQLAETPAEAKRWAARARAEQKRVRELLADKPYLVRKYKREQVGWATGHATVTRTPRNSPVGRIVVPTAKGYSVADHEMVVAQHFAGTGHQIEFLVPARLEGVKTQDILLDGTEWEMKSPLGAGKNTIENQMRRAGHQSSRLILDTSRRALDDDAIITEVRRRLDGGASHLEQVIVLRKDRRSVLIGPGRIADYT